MFISLFLCMYVCMYVKVHVWLCTNLAVFCVLCSLGVRHLLFVGWFVLFFYSLLLTWNMPTSCSAEPENGNRPCSELMRISIGSDPENSMHFSRKCVRLYIDLSSIVIESFHFSFLEKGKWKGNRRFQHIFKLNIFTTGIIVNLNQKNKTKQLGSPT